VLITRPVSRSAKPEEVADAIGGFVLINDFSARDTQLSEMLSSALSLIKGKSCATGMARDVVSVEELWAPGDNGKLFGEGLKCDVKVNGELWRGSLGEQMTTAEPSRLCSVEELIAFMALDEGLLPGELIGLGTVPNCCGVEIDKWLSPGDEITLSVEGLGELRNTIGTPPRDAVNHKDLRISSTKQPGRIKFACKMLFNAFVTLPICLLFILGSCAALVWPGPNIRVAMRVKSQDKESCLKEQLLADRDSKE